MEPCKHEDTIKSTATKVVDITVSAIKTALDFINPFK